MWICGSLSYLPRIKINNNGVTPSHEKIENIRMTKEPCSFLNYNHKLLPPLFKKKNSSETLDTLYEHYRKGVNWEWGGRKKGKHLKNLKLNL